LLSKTPAGGFAQAVSPAQASRGGYCRVHKVRKSGKRESLAVSRV
jgi:hypothetical protein